MTIVQIVGRNELDHNYYYDGVIQSLHLQKPPVTDLNEVFQRIRDAVYKNGIRTTEFFRDHDKLRSGVITENQVPT